MPSPPGVSPRAVWVPRQRWPAPCRTPSLTRPGRRGPSRGCPRPTWGRGVHGHTFWGSIWEKMFRCENRPKMAKTPGILSAMILPASPPLPPGRGPAAPWQVGGQQPGSQRWRRRVFSEDGFCTREGWSDLPGAWLPPLRLFGWGGECKQKIPFPGALCQRKTSVLFSNLQTKKMWGIFTPIVFWCFVPLCLGQCCNPCQATSPGSSLPPNSLGGGWSQPPPPKVCL